MQSAPRRVSVKPARMNIVKGRKLDALKDVPDIRDRIYEPTLAPLPPNVPVPGGLTILDQGKDGACTGFALAAAINLLLATNDKLAATERARRVSPHMLYVMARQHDEWPGERYEGSSLRGALRGFFNCGVCLDKLWKAPNLNELSLQSAQDARNTTLGAYFRLRPHLPDYHAALSETGVIFASATVHRGWDDPVKARITTGQGVSLHAFDIIGYDQDGFWIQNSWGKTWGDKGVAHWPYEDWASNIQDAWVLQLAIPAPCAFGLGRMRGQGRTGADISRTKRMAPARTDIAGHYVHVDNGNFSKAQPYWSDERDVVATAELMSKTKDYQHFLFYAHGGLNAPDDAAMRTAAMKDVFKENGVYPYSVFYDTGLLKTLKDLILGRADEINTRTGGLLDLTDALIEKSIGSIGTKLWNEMKADARLPFEQKRDGELAIKLFVAQLTARVRAGLPPLQIHLAGHSTGAILIGHLLTALDRVLPAAIHVQSCSLMAPACSVAFFQEHYRPRLGKLSQALTKIDRLKVYCLKDPAEQDDQVTPLYNIEALASGESTSLRAEFRCRRKDGVEILIGTHGTGAEVEGKRVILGMLQDISENRRAADTILEYATRLKRALLGTVDAVSRMVEMRDPYTAGHEHRVGVLAADIAAEMGMSDDVQTGLRIAGAVHDVGKITVPSEILTKPGRLSPVEYELVKEHAQKGYDVLNSVDFSWPVAEVARQHHERMDGSGYPRGLKGEDIIIEARITAVADVVESMASHRPYRASLGVDKALVEIESHAGQLYDSNVAAACLRLFRDKGYQLPA